MMRKENEIREEIQRRKSFNNSESYSGYRTNKSIIFALEWVLMLREFKGRGNNGQNKS